MPEGDLKLLSLQQSVRPISMNAGNWFLPEWIQYCLGLKHLTHISTYLHYTPCRVRTETALVHIGTSVVEKGFFKHKGLQRDRVL